MPWDVSLVASFFYGVLQNGYSAAGREICRKHHPHDFISEQNNPPQNQVYRYFR